MRVSSCSSSNLGLLGFLPESATDSWYNPGQVTPSCCFVSPLHPSLSLSQFSLLCSPRLKGLLCFADAAVSTGGGGALRPGGDPAAVARRRGAPC